MKTVIRTIPHGLRLIDAEEDKYIRLWANEAFGDLEICKRFEYQTGANYCILVYSEDELVSFAAVLERSVRFDDDELTLGGVGGVVTAPEHRGRGFASMAMKESVRVIFRTLKADVGGLLCLNETVGFYEKLGWKLSHAKVMVELKGSNVVWPEAFMFYERDGSCFNPKNIDVCGRPW